MATFSLILLFSLSTMILSLADNISIDCGTSGSYVDENNVKWVGDEGFIAAGESFKIEAAVSKPLSTLRYFPTGETNCYSDIPVTKGEKVLLRTMFFHGNYDGQFLVPAFDVVYDGKHRVTVTISSFVDRQFSEVIFVPGSASTSVCLVRTSSLFNPFISTIEAISLDADMYGDLGPNEGLIYQQRIAYGAEGLVSYPLDRYGRIWLALRTNFTVSVLTTSASSIDTSGASNNPPETVLRTAWSAKDLTLVNPTLPIGGVPVYLAMYLSEPLSLGQTQKRSFNIYFGGKQIGSGPVVAAFGKTTQVVVRDVVANSTSQIFFESTDDSSLPPIINALELYVISRGASSGGGGEKEKQNHISLILGVTLGSVLALLSGIAVFVSRKRHNAKLPTTLAGSDGGRGTSPLVGGGLASDGTIQRTTF